LENYKEGLPAVADLPCLMSIDSEVHLEHWEITKNSTNFRLSQLAKCHFKGLIAEFLTCNISCSDTNILKRMEELKLLATPNLRLKTKVCYSF